MNLDRFSSWNVRRILNSFLEVCLVLQIRTVMEKKPAALLCRWWEAQIAFTFWMSDSPELSVNLDCFIVRGEKKKLNKLEIITKVMLIAGAQSSFAAYLQQRQRCWDERAGGKRAAAPGCLCWAPARAAQRAWALLRLMTSAPALGFRLA